MDRRRSCYQEEGMRQIAEFVAVLASALFTGAAVYINLVEHPARMQCGVELAATEFAPSYRRGTVMQATCASRGSAVVTRSVACRGNRLVADCRSLSRLGHSVHVDRDLAHEQAIAQSGTR
jgi:hypothetical protein